MVLTIELCWTLEYRGHRTLTGWWTPLSRLSSVDPFDGLPDDAKICYCFHTAFYRWLPRAWGTAKWLWGLVVLLFGAIVTGIVEDEDVLWQTCLAAAGLSLALAVVATAFAYRFGTRGARGAQSQIHQHETPADVVALFA